MESSKSIKTVVIGVGNPILSDDSVGIKISRLLKDRLREDSSTYITELYAGGFRLMEAMVGFERAFIIDAIKTGAHAPGSIRVLEPSEFNDSRYLSCMHDSNLQVALEIGRRTDTPLPEEIKIWAIEVSDVDTFSEELTPEVKKSVDQVAENIILELKKGIIAKCQK
jgi:hydrogenase maturation protease